MIDDISKKISDKIYELKDNIRDDTLKSNIDDEDFRGKISLTIVNEENSKEKFIDLGLTSENYGEIRNILNGVNIDSNRKIIANIGRRGGLRVINEDQIPHGDKVASEIAIDKEIEKNDKSAQQKEEKELRLEKNFYELVQKWAMLNGYTNCVVTGGRLPGFKWENPDLIHPDYWLNEMTPAIEFNIVSFEVKLRVEPFAVWQAAHYLNFSEYVFLVFAKPEKEIRDKDDGRVFKFAVDMGLGVLAWSKDSKEFNLIQSPRQFYPSQSRVIECIKNFKSIPEVEKLTQKALDAYKKRMGLLIANAMGAVT